MILDTQWILKKRVWERTKLSNRNLSHKNLKMLFKKWMKNSKKKMMRL